MQSLGPPATQDVDTDWERLRVGAPQGTGGEEFVARKGHRGSAGVLEGHQGGVLGRDGKKAGRGCRPGRRGGGGRPGAALGLSSYYRLPRGDELLVVLCFVQVVLYRLSFSFVLFFVLTFLSFVSAER